MMEFAHGTLSRSTLTMASLLLVAPVIASAQESVADWSRDVWSAAQQGELERLEAELAEPPATAIPTNAAVFSTTFEGHEANSVRSLEELAEARAKAETELNEHIADGETAQALRSAIELQTLSDDMAAALDAPVTKALIKSAEQRVPEAIAAGDWLEAQTLLFYLRTLHEDTDRLEDYLVYFNDLEEINDRVALLAKYAPKALYDLRVLRAERLGEDAPAPYNPRLNGRWEERTAGIRADLLRTSLYTAATEHIESGGWEPLLDGGIDALELLGSTPLIVESFPTMSDSGEVQEWVDGLDELRIEVDTDLAQKSGHRAFSELLDEVVALNAESIQLPLGVIYREFGDGAAGSLDRFSQIIWPDELRRFRQQTEGNFVGVGILIRENDTSEIMVVNPLEGTPAYHAGVKADDVVVTVNGESTVGWTLNDAVDHITGPRGSDVVLGLRREGADGLVDIPIIRDRIKLYSVQGWEKTDLDADGAPQWDWFIDPTNHIAYVKLTQFSEDTYGDLLSALSEMRAEYPDQNVPSGLILDLRYNPGGLLTSAAQISNLFVEEGVIVTGEDRMKSEMFRLTAQPNRAYLSDTPTVVLINKGSASASEIVSGCVQAHNAGLVLGERSFGKGSVQTVHPVSPAARLKLTTQYYRLPSPDGRRPGRLVHKRPGAMVWGVDPDITVTMRPSQVVDSVNLRRDADVIPLDDAGNPWPASPDRADPSDLLTKGLDPQLEMALLILQAQAMGKDDAEARRAQLD